MNKKLKIGIVGFGNMGRAIAESLFFKRVVYVYDNDKKKTKGTRASVLGSLKELLRESSVVILAIKPQDIKDFIAYAHNYLIKKNILLISIAAGVPTGFFEKNIGKVRVIRVMPNLAAKVKGAVSFISRGRFASKKDLETAVSIFKNIGIVFTVKEDFLDKATSISGSGPGYIYYFMDSMMQAAIRLGFGKKTAQKMIQQTFLGAVKLALESKENFQVLINNVASRGGTTEAALSVFEKNRLPNTIKKAVDAAYKRAKKLAKTSN